MKVPGASLGHISLALSFLMSVADGAFAQKLPKNTNQSNKLKSGISSGAGNLIMSNSAQSFIGGGSVNTIASNALYAVVAGGYDNAVAGNGGAIGGGANNLAQGQYAVVPGGRGNVAAQDCAVIGGGFSNNVAGLYGTIAGGFFNAVTNIGATIGGGFSNTSTGTLSTLSGGFANSAEGAYSMIPGGIMNEAEGVYSFAAGARAQANHNSSFVWGGWHEGVTASTNTNSFTVRAPGGARFITATNLVGAILASGATAWAALSDSNAKTGIEPVQPREILKKVAAMPVTSWRYKHDPQRRYIGPMAQDFHEAFGLGVDDKTISTLDTDGVTLAAIQGLVEELKDRDAQIEALKAGFEAELSEIREQLNRRPPAP